MPSGAQWPRVSQHKPGQVGQGSPRVVPHSLPPNSIGAPGPTYVLHTRFFRNKPHFVLAVDRGRLGTACRAGGGMLEGAGAGFPPPTCTWGVLPESTQLPPPCTCPRRATLSPNRGLGAGRVGVRVIDLSVSGQSKCPRQGLSGLQCIRWVTQISRPLTQPSRDLRHFDAEAAVLLGVACLPRGLGQQAVGRVDAWRPAFLLSVMAQCPGLAAGGRGKLVACGCWVWGPS